MAKGLFFNCPMYGHAIPTFAVVQELVSEGEQITYYLTDEFAQSIRAAGATFRRYESTMKNNRPSGRFSRYLAEECQYVIPQIIESVKSEEPDYIIYESGCLWGRILSHIFQIPIISCRASLAVNNHFSYMPYLLDTNRGTLVASFQLISDTLNDIAPLADLCATYHLPPPEQTMDSIFFHSEDLNIIFGSRMLQPAGDTFDERFIFVGPPIAHRKTFSDTLNDRPLPLPSPAVLYISLGTIYNMQPDFYKLCFQAFGKQPWHVIIAVGKHVDDAELGPVPENFLLRTSVPQLDILQHADIFITHGGYNSVMEALYYGVPMIIIPQMPEQAIVARRIAELGLGIVLDNKRLNTTVLQEAVHRLSHDSSFRDRVKLVQKEVQVSGGAQCAAEAILRFVSQKRAMSEI
jgi:MGT family glycosyltransferase